MTTTVTVEVHDTPPDIGVGDVVVYNWRQCNWGVCDARKAIILWDSSFTHWHLPIDVTIMSKEQP